MKEKKTAERTKNKAEYSPVTDIFESKDSYTVVCEMPGVDETGVDIGLEKSELSIRGEQKDLPVDNLYHQEYLAGIYQRTFKIPDVINKEAITAKIKNGVLTVVLPKAEQEKPRTIEVKAA